jgi:NADPH:quinone reductase-like Zn-dependent oxidoreductase
MYLVSHFAPGKSILWHAAASSVSIAGIQLSAADGATKVFGTARQDDKCDLAKSLGATAAFNTKTTNWVDEVLKATDGKGVDIIIDFIGAESFQGNLDAIAQDGVIVTLGMLGGIKLKEGTDISAFVRTVREGASEQVENAEFLEVLRSAEAEGTVQISGEGARRGVKRVVGAF